GDRVRDLAVAELGAVEGRRLGARGVEEGDALEVEEAVHPVGRSSAQIDAGAGTTIADLDDVVAATAIELAASHDLRRAAEEERVGLAAADNRIEAAGELQNDPVEAAGAPVREGPAGQVERLTGGVGQDANGLIAGGAGDERCRRQA